MHHSTPTPTTPIPTAIFGSSPPMFLMFSVIPVHAPRGETYFHRTPIPYKLRCAPMGVASPPLSLNASSKPVSPPNRDRSKV